jgi:4-amino-4-deoxy-L-arabinose transferase-like glycosyltransferase
MTAHKLTLREFALLALFALIVFIPGFVSLPPIDRDESRYLVATTQMLDTGDFVDIRFQDEPRHLQPAGIYWLQSITAGLLTEPGAREVWAYRLPSLFSAIGAVLLTGFIGTSLFGRTAGLAAGVLLASCVSLGFEARIAKIDATLLLAITAAQTALMLLYLQRTQRPRLIAAVFWAAIGAGLMLKGPIILIVVGLTVLALSLWDRNWRWLSRLHAGWGVLVTLAIALPWYIAIGVQTDGAFFDRAVGKSFLGKVATSQQGHKGPFGYHLAMLPAMFWPASLFALLSVPFAWRNRAAPEVKFLIAWIVPAWIVYEIVATKLPHYVLPTYPALACLAGCVFFSSFGVRAAASPWLRAGAIAVAAIWMLVTLVFALLPSIFPLVGRQPLPEGFGPLIGEIGAAIGASGPGVQLVSVLTLIAGIAVLVFLARREDSRAVGAAAAAGFLALANTFAFATPALEPVFPSPRIVAAANAAKPCVDSRLITTPYHEPSLVFLYGSRAVLLAKSPEEAADALAADRACGLALIGTDRLPAFQARAAALGLSPRRVGAVAGQNYSDEAALLDLGLYVAD